ncbi:MAG: M13 family peptidase [Kordiimonadaceae bacterium]|nr:M13 family peptidase [Kordiimonadaceae bacterium]MBO6567576.1 M13 family peptidase [Kordiimonadaceae bacterium]MBO6963210.1 M13 family peptidase [Kordiimonadaceae bacterium]
MKQFLKTSVALSALMLAACSDSGNDTTASNETDMVAEAAKPELGSFGIDMTAAKPSVAWGENFFVAANGAWIDEFEIPADRSNYGAFNVLGDRSRDRTKSIIDDLAAGTFEAGSVEQKISDYYNSYMDIETVNSLGIEPLRPALAAIASINSMEDLVRAFGAAGRDNTSSPITAGIGINRGNPDRYVLNMGIGGIGLPDRDYYLQDSEDFNAKREAYVAHIAEMLTFAGVENAEEKAAAILALETRIAEKQWPRAQRRNRDMTFNPMSVADFKAKYTGFDWDAFMAGAGISDLEDLNVSHPDPVADAVALVNEISIDDWKAYLTYHLINNHAALLSEEIDTASFSFFGQTLFGQPQQRARWERGVQRVGARNALGEALGQVYVDRYFPPEAKAEMVQLVENLRTALGQRIDGLDWMSEDTKVEARAKLASFNPKIAYPDEWRDLSGIEIKAGDLFGNAKSVANYNYADQIARLSRPTNKDEWFMTPQTVNAYYNPQFNEIVFPAAILQPPFFDLAADPAVNYGGIGAVIGHEMGHGFDDQGSKSDDKGVQRNWWTDADRSNFEVKADALVAQYNTFEPVEGNFVDGRFTLGENIGDLGGLSMAYHAYKLSLGGEEAPVIDGLTGDQRFFLAWAQVWKRKYRDDALIARLKSDPHSPAEYRVNGVVRNMAEWYEAFGVKETDALYLAPEDRVAIW